MLTRSQLIDLLDVTEAVTKDRNPVVVPHLRGTFAAMTSISAGSGYYDYNHELKYYRKMINGNKEIPIDVENRLYAIQRGAPPDMRCESGIPTILYVHGLFA